MSNSLHVPSDTVAAHRADTSEKVEHSGLVLTTTILASSLAFVDGSVVNVSLPAIAGALYADASDLQWTVNAYLLPLSALLLLGGAVGDRFGQRAVLILGVGLFALASGACAIAPTVSWLLGGRLLQGAGAALLMPNSLAILGRTFSGAAKGRAIGMWAAAGAVAAAIGPVLGGWLVDLGSWRAIFLINLPLAAAAIALAWLYVPRDRQDKDGALDVWGGVLATGGLGFLTWALTTGAGQAGWTANAVFGLCAGAVLLMLFVLAEKRLGEKAMMPLQLFGSRTFVGLTLLTLLLYGALGGLMVLVPYVLIEGNGYSGTASGAALLPLPLILSLMSPLAGGLSAKIGPRLPLTIGPLLVAVGILFALRIGPSENYWLTVFPAISVIAFGMAGAVAPLTTAVLSSVDARHVGSASGFNSAVARTGGLIATALIGSVLAAKGPQLVSAFGTAAVIGAIACVAASLSAFLLIRDS
jgi:EmrB/QacA subfamily drug resistance transporter